MYQTLVQVPVCSDTKIMPNLLTSSRLVITGQLFHSTGAIIRKEKKGEERREGEKGEKRRGGKKREIILVF